MKQEVFTLTEGDAVLRWPSEMSPESYADFKDWLDLIARKAERASQAPKSDPKLEPAAP